MSLVWLDPAATGNRTHKSSWSVLGPPYRRLLRSAGATEDLFVTRELHQEPPPRIPTGHMLTHVPICWYLCWNICMPDICLIFVWIRLAAWYDKWRIFIVILRLKDHHKLFSSLIDNYERGREKVNPFTLCVFIYFALGLIADANEMYMQ